MLKMAIQAWKDKIFELGRQAGFSDMEVYYQSGKNFEATVFEGDISKYSVSDEKGMAFRGILNGKMGYAYTEIITEEAIAHLVEEARSNAQIIETEEEVFIYKGGQAPKPLNLYNESLQSVKNEDKLKFLLDVEKHAKALDERVFRVAYNLYSDSENTLAIANSHGLDISERSNLALAYLSVVVKSGEEQKSGTKFVYGNDFTKYDAKAMAAEAVEEALSQFGAKSMTSGDYEVVIRNKESASLLQCFAPNFSSENVQKSLSKLIGKQNEQVASTIVTITDDPHLEGGLMSRSFDGEGVATKKHNVIENGILKTFLYNLKTANVEGVKSNG